MTSTRRPATDSDLTVGAIVYKGQGKTAWQVVSVHPDRVLSSSTRGTVVALCKAGAQARPGNAEYTAHSLTVSV